MGQLARFCPKKNEDGGIETATATIMTVSSVIHTMPNSGKSDIRKLDSANTEHMANDCSYFDNFTAFDGNVQVGDTSNICSYGVEIVKVVVTANGRQEFLTLKDVVFALEIIYSLISVSQVRKHNFCVTMDDDDDNPRRRRIELQHEPSGSVRWWAMRRRKVYFGLLFMSQSKNVHMSPAKITVCGTYDLGTLVVRGYES